MAHRRLDRNLENIAWVYAASILTTALGLFFVFVWAPHPWGHEGFDNYHQLALMLAAGQPFPTMEVPWGYAYFAALFYRVFGDRPAILLVAQVLLNAAVPWLVYRFAVTWTGRRTAVLAALITGVFSFNTIYASTQSSDAVCTVIAMTAFVVFAVTSKGSGWQGFAIVGALTGLAPQFRPNLILVPLVLAAYALFEVRSRRRLAQALVLLLCAAAALTPWVVRNYRLTRTVLPTSVHGGVQLWYGTLQVGQYLHSRAYNPRNVFEAPAFDYTSLDSVPIVIAAQAKACAEAPPSEAALVYWSDRDTAPRRVSAQRMNGGAVQFELPAAGTNEVVYYYFDATWPIDGHATRVPTPPRGPAGPFVYFVSQDHLGDLDVHGDLIDIFDLVRIARHLAWGEPIERLKQGAISADGLEQVASILAHAAIGSTPGRIVRAVEHDRGLARLVLSDGSTIEIPRAWSGRATDLNVSGALALAMLSATAPRAVWETAVGPAPAHAVACAQFEDIAVNRVFYRREPHLMRRYSALAFDNIRRDPSGFLLASAYRALRVFIIEGTDDRHTAQQFSRSTSIYAIARLATTAYFVLFVAGIWIAWRRGDSVLLPLALIAYVPLTIAPVLTNMRYWVTVQPLVFMFVAVALTALLERAGWRVGSRATPDRGDARITPRP